MEITISVKDPTPDFERDLLKILNRYRASLHHDLGWNVERARTFYNALAPRAQNILREAVTRGGTVPADALRGDDAGSLRGHSSSFARLVLRGSVNGWWGSGMKSPIVALGPGSGKVQGYQISDQETLAAFSAVIADRTDEK
ncbi:hypothetical protein ACFC08_28400 [Streptomyces sp. NPDC056112]|uniref:hypothetical protein n=1 Tax=Streptomyces sp. NPDC056112 TaxID=3345715 RepID=UPI0035DE299C